MLVIEQEGGGTAPESIPRCRPHVGTISTGRSQLFRAVAKGQDTQKKLSQGSVELRLCSLGEDGSPSIILPLPCANLSSQIPNL